MHEVPAPPTELNNAPVQADFNLTMIINKHTLKSTEHDVRMQYPLSEDNMDTSSSEGQNDRSVYCFIAVV